MYCIAGSVFTTMMTDNHVSRQAEAGMRTTFLLLCLLTLFLFPLEAVAQTGKIAGQITDAETGEPLPGVNVVLAGTTTGTASDIDGHYFIINLPPGTYSVQASMVGYALVTVQDVQVISDQTTDINFELVSETVQGDEVVVVATRPILERDLTASQSYIDGAELQMSWANSVTEAITQEAGIVLRGGGFVSSRGGMWTDLNYRVDGASMQSGVLGDNYNSINTTSVQEMRLLTGGYNAEYGQALSGIIDVVTKEGSGSINGTVLFRMRPPGKYHWGDNMYSDELYDHTGFDLSYWQENDGGRPDLTPEERYQLWKDFVGNPDPTMANYTKRAEWETEATISGGITNKLGFLVSGRFLREVNEYPQSKPYNPEWNGQLKLTYRFSPTIKLSASGIYGGYDTAGQARSFLFSNEASAYGTGNTSLHGRSTQVTHPYAFNKYFPYTRFNAGMPMEMRVNTQNISFNHTLNNKTFYEIQLNRFWQYTGGVADNERFFEVYPDEESGWYKMRNNYLLGVRQFETLAGSPLEWAKSWSEKLTLDVDLTSQVTPNHQFKVGGLINYYDLDFDERMTLFQSGGNRTSWQNKWSGNPIDGALYIQDKMEYKGMVINAGVRFDFFNAMHDAPVNFWDPFGVEYESAGHDPNDPPNAFPGWENLVTRRTPWQFAIAPRFGISHPITETTILHFSYGHFFNRPGWYKIMSKNYRWRDDNFEPVAHETFVEKEPSHGVLGNPYLDYEQLIQYEVGIDQEILGMFLLDATLYYKEGKNLTSARMSTMTDEITSGSANATAIYSTVNPENYQVVMPVNMGIQDVRGIEVGVDARLSSMLRASISYDKSYNLYGRVGWSSLHEPARNQPNGRQGLQDAAQRWNPTDKVKATGNIILPKGWGPSLAGFRPFSDLNLNVYWEYWSGRLYTFHSVERGDTSTEPLNRRWLPHFRTNLRISKGLNFTDSIVPELAVEVRNLFNNKDLNRPSGRELEAYLYEGEMWVNDWSGEPDVWNWYDMGTNPPRQVYISLSFNF